MWLEASQALTVMLNGVPTLALAGAATVRRTGLVITGSKNRPLRTALPVLLRLVILMLMSPEPFHTRYSPLLKLDTLSVSSTVPVVASVICTCSLHAALSQSSRYNAN